MTPNHQIFVVALAIAFCAINPIEAFSKSKNIGDWSVKEEDDDFSDEKKYVAMKISGDGIFGVRCISKSPSIVIATAASYGKGDLFTVKIRVDKGEIVDGVGGALTDKLLEISPFDNSYFKKIGAGKKISFRVSGSSGSMDHAFSINGIDRVMPGLLETCNLK